MAASVSPFLLTPKFPSMQNSCSLPTSFLLTVPTNPRTPRTFCCSLPNQTADQNGNAENKTGECLRVAFAAGGTGGHIYPAVAIADQLKNINPNTQILFFGTPKSMESKAVTSAGYDFATIRAVPLVRPPLSLRNLLFPYQLFKSLIESWNKLRDFNPHIVVGTGGYVSFPVCLAAAFKGLRLVIQEQNSVPGIANWVLSYFADQVFVAFNSSIACFPKKNKYVVTGNPVRASVRQNVSKADARLLFFPKSEKARDSKAKVVLVLGGSLGAHAINIAILNLYHQMLLEHKNWFLVWQTGVEAFDEMESLVKVHPHVLLRPFLRSMDLAYAAADLIVSRAGAMTCSEILAAGKPSVLIPSPNVSEGHQFANASLMADLAGSRIITEDELDSTTLGIVIEEILGDEHGMTEMCERALKAAKPNASTEIAQSIVFLANSLKA
ncbi:uncharacterized protein LOC131145992 isoform X2 [Malania oleifera]|uniref:uncharacterized protein LOC131145992 isoform X2 n=1 Tax=Malania oleifera TaxID=397392 RepID=UPI0025AE6D77|nr:uncharacterized protein LOC131145992 isoform X2 [Malania oleifera]